MCAITPNINSLFVSFILLVFSVIFSNYPINCEINTLVRQVVTSSQYNRIKDTILPNKNLPGDTGLNVSQLANKYGYPFESHTVNTKDGYLIDLHRIPHGRYENDQQVTEKRPVVLLVSAFLFSSGVWITSGPEKSLGFILADNGYDVWMSNTRGTMHGRKHLKMDPDKDRNFWDFSWHEMGMDDLPTAIDYVLGKTNETSLTYVGHSQGIMQLLVMLSELPDYNDKLRVAIALAPGGFFSNIKNNYVRYASKKIRELDLMFKLRDINEIAPYSDIFVNLTLDFCYDTNPVQALCLEALSVVDGYDDEQFNKSLLPVIVHHAPAGCSAKQLMHLLQLVRAKRFQMYDYGPFRNQIRYGRDIPPAYNLKNAVVPTYIFYGPNDGLVSEKDAERLATLLPKAMAIRVNHPKFNHFDFIWAKDVVPLVYDKLLQIAKMYR